LGWAGAGRGMKGGLTWALVGGSSLRLSGPGPDSLAAPAAGAGSGSGSGAIYGAWMGRGGGGRSTSSPHLHRPVGREKGGRATGWEGATEPGEEGGLRVAQRQDPRRHSDIHLPLLPHPHPASQRGTHCGGACTHTHSRREAMETYAPTTRRLTHSLDTNRCQHINSP